MANVPSFRFSFGGNIRRNHPFGNHPFANPRNGGVTNGGLRGVWPPFLEISRNRPFSPFFRLFRPFPEGPNSTWEIQKTEEEKGLFPQISSDFLKPPSLKPPFAALQIWHKRGFCMPYVWVCNTVCHIFCRNPLIFNDLYAIRTLIVWHISGAYFSHIWGGGGGQN